ncbi:MAG: esterase family protein [Verrucomicrobia bacterium]|nr:esterase family protein [Verrucomicrobiota bacterium]
MNVLLPQKTISQIGLSGSTVAGLPPVLYLLHGLSDDHTIWMRRTSIERYVSELGLAVVMPAVHRSFYTDMPSGLKYFEFVSKELPALCESFFRLSASPVNKFIAGLSMGGYGAFKVALSYPTEWAGAASLSGALDVKSIFTKRLPERSVEAQAIFGPMDKVGNSTNDLFFLLQQASKNPHLPELFSRCGTQDFLIEENREFVAHCNACGVKVDYAEAEGAAHTWDYWDASIQQVLMWIKQLTKN